MNFNRGALASLAAACSVVALLGLLACSDDVREVSGVEAVTSSLSGGKPVSGPPAGEGDVVAETTGPTSELPNEVDAKTLKELARYGVDATVVDESGHGDLFDLPGVLARDPVDLGLPDDVPVTQVALVRMTDRDYGENLEEDPAKAPRLQLKIEHRLVWLVIIDDLPQREVERYQPGEQVKEPEVEYGTGAYAFDAKTGKDLFGMSW